MRAKSNGSALRWKICPHDGSLHLPSYHHHRAIVIDRKDAFILVLGRYGAALLLKSCLIDSRAVKLLVEYPQADGAYICSLFKSGYICTICHEPQTNLPCRSFPSDHGLRKKLWTQDQLIMCLETGIWTASRPIGILRRREKLAACRQG